MRTSEACSAANKREASGKWNTLINNPFFGLFIGLPVTKPNWSYEWRVRRKYSTRPIWGILSFRVDFHCRVIFTCVNMDVSFTRENKIKTRHEVLRLIVKLSEVRLLLLHAIFFIHSLSFIWERKFYARTHVTRVSWKFDRGQKPRWLTIFRIFKR